MSQKDYLFKLKNLGINDEFFEKITCIKKDKIRKVCSDGAITEVDLDKSLHNKRVREAEDIYGGYVNEFNPYQEQEEENYSSNSDDYSEEEEESHKKLNSESISNLEIFSNISQKQLVKLNEIVKDYNNEKKGIIIKAYKSKLKLKYTHLYEENSKAIENKTRFKLFHKCNFPNCNRTFASAGWLSSHFEEHTQEIDSCKFNKLFEIMKKYF